MSNVQFAKDIYEAFGRGDMTTVLARLHPKLEWRGAEGNPYGRAGAALFGPQAVQERLFARLGPEWEGFTLTVHTLHDAGDHVVMEGRYAGTYKLTNTSVNAQVCHVLRFKDGKLVRFQQYVDTAQLQSAMATGWWM